ncbi:UDP-N-acetylmuramate dehydrogenase [Thioalkalivibrio sp. XN8]|uniref:UDP-N-acetylmuramate dehydrogenase n=1 Tax=Thioalkalivibrio sp. XN8 TaxID=2712863 RepID=UPI0013ECE215|nr:UDP-N-acetylmuramate dehydrogenase [Thioalkalivibrio sp. XN8]NGP52173.1 UDP-N-acetylmuramate dehydrogenase [Thioalkalivibrio sp. XN8]
MAAMQHSPAFEPRGELRRHEPMARHTSWRVGGPVDTWYRPADLEDLAGFLAALPPEVPVHWVGLGSNLLVRDGGLRGAVISTHNALSAMARLGAHGIRAEAGVPCAKIARSCARWGLGAGEFFAGIPGTLGGALAMNAGAFGGETWDYVRAVETLDRAGVRRRRARDEYETGYRSVRGPAGEWFVAAELQFPAGRPTTQASIRDLLVRRKATQPIGLPSCGSVFTNPPGDHAARLIEAAGLKGCRIGGAEVSPKHANFIINTGEATAADIEALVRHVAAEVERVHGVRLATEVRVVGDPAPAAPEARS